VLRVVEFVLVGSQLFVAVAKMMECLAIAPDDGGMGAFSKRELPGIVFSEARAFLAGATLQLSALGRVLKTDILR